MVVVHPLFHGAYASSAHGEHIGVIICALTVSSPPNADSWTQLMASDAAIIAANPGATLTGLS
jgi:hypothetical protein